jgi:hypothetical protein
MIDDDDIDCPLPTISLDGYDAKVELFRHVVLHAQISSAVMKEKLSRKTRQMSPTLQIRMIKNMEARLKRWHDDLPSYLKPQIPVQHNNLAPGILLEHKLWIHFSYYATLGAIHSNFACPWNPPDFDADLNGTIRAQFEQSMLTVADAARKTILATRSITVSASSPLWLV